jgi:SAM-dependent methyltransferase
LTDIYTSGVYEAHNPSWHEEDSPWKASQVARMIERNGLRPRQILEVGCGTGEILLELEARFPEPELIGWEIAPGAFERARAKQTARTSFRFGDLLAQEMEPVDLLLAIDVFEHVPDYMGFVAGLRDKARLTMFHIPLDMSAQSVARARPILSLREGVGHLHYFMKDTALALLEDSGYRIVDWFYTASRLELPNQSRTSRLMRLPRRLLYRFDADLAVRVLGGYSLLVLAQ